MKRSNNELKSSIGVKEDTEEHELIAEGRDLYKPSLLFFPKQSDNVE